MESICALEMGCITASQIPLLLSGKNWKRVYDEGWVMKLVESNGVLIATSQRGIIRSVDDGESWVNVIDEGGVGIAIERIKGGFAAITCNTETEARRVWQLSLPATLLTEKTGYKKIDSLRILPSAAPYLPRNVELVNVRS
ncbi:hypothetical protein [Dyadobacter sp. OTU695]|uniref:hypothetical protein n=1 Tax=Dyadobacter sp. OTU695 TaxID=3043860 RepID=UPI00313D112E